MGSKRQQDFGGEHPLLVLAVDVAVIFCGDSIDACQPEAVGLAALAGKIRFIRIF